MDISSLKSNVIFLGLLCIFLTSLISVSLYYSLDEQKRKKESVPEKIIRCVVPSLNFSLSVIIIIYIFRPPVKKYTFINEGFWD